MAVGLAAASAWFQARSSWISWVSSSEALACPFTSAASPSAPMARKSVQFFFMRVFLRQSPETVSLRRPRSFFFCSLVGLIGREDTTSELQGGADLLVDVCSQRHLG